MAYHSLTNEGNFITRSIYVSRSNAEEARSVTRGFDLFIRDRFQLDPAFFCSSNLLAHTLEGYWDSVKRVFLSTDEKKELDKLDGLEDEVTAKNKNMYIQRPPKCPGLKWRWRQRIKNRYPPHKRRRLPPSTPSTLSSVVSALSGNTRESKAKVYATEGLKKVAVQHIVTISNLNEHLDSNRN